jgi:hypothetical protein
MKSFLKKTAISMLVMGMAGTSFAAMSHNTAMWSPHMNGWFIGVDGLDIRPMNGDLDFVSINPTSHGSYYSQAISTDYQWSWRLYGGIKFTDNDDITLSWIRMRADDSNSVGILEGNGGIPKWLDNSSWDSISGKVDFDLDDVYGVWGHTINFNNPWSVRFAAGLDYVRLNSDMTVNAVVIDSSNGSIGNTAHSHLRGFGPRVEFDATYHLPYNFALFANANAALFMSERKISIYPNVSPDIESDFFSTSFSTRHVVVPKFGMRLGASYGWMFGQSGGEGGSVSTLTIDAGWQVESYIHAIERPDGDFFDESFQTTQASNFGDQGLFVGIKYSSDWL